MSRVELPPPALFGPAFQPDPEPAMPGPSLVLYRSGDGPGMERLVLDGSATRVLDADVRATPVRIQQLEVVVRDIGSGIVGSIGSLFSKRDKKVDGNTYALPGGGMGRETNRMEGLLFWANNPSYPLHEQLSANMPPEAQVERVAEQIALIRGAKLNEIDKLACYVSDENFHNELPRSELTRYRCEL